MPRSSRAASAAGYGELVCQYLELRDQHPSVLLLFHRRRNGLELTEVGTAYLPGISEALDRAEAATQGLMGARAQTSLTVSAPLSCAMTRSTGPPGANCTTRNDTSMMPTRVGIISKIRRAI